MQKLTKFIPHVLAIFSSIIFLDGVAIQTGSTLIAAMTRIMAMQRIFH